MELWNGHNGAKEGESTKGRKTAKRVVPRVQKENKVYTITDPLHKMTIKPSSAGDLVPDSRTGYFQTRSAMLASEIKARYPYMLVTEHERLHGDSTYAPSLRVNGLRTRKLTDEEMEQDGWVKDGARWVKRL